MKTPSSLEDLISALRCLPVMGPKSARRTAFRLLQRDQAGAARLAPARTQALASIRQCEQCNSYTEAPVCELCSSPRRDPALLCVVETPGDLLMMEQAQCYQGLYFVLMGVLSPLDGIGPREIHADRLLRRATDGRVRDAILATNFTVEGEATAHYLGEALRARGLTVSRIARGLPVGGELEHVDSGPLAGAW